MRLWIDDFRAPPDESWVWAKTLAAAFKEFYAAMYAGNWFNEPIVEISFDHDLGVLTSFDNPLPEDQTTMPLARLIEEQASTGIKPPKWSVHSMNPVGAKNLRATLESADRLYAKSLEKAE
jgi:hypothetical protein